MRNSPASPSEARDVIVAISVFCKCVELGLLKSLSSASVRDWFHENIMCRYGVPAAVRCDRGAEFRAEFESYCKCNGIQIHHIATRNPRAQWPNRTIQLNNRMHAPQVYKAGCVVEHIVGHDTCVAIVTGKD